MTEPSEENPRYKIEQYGSNNLYMITCDEGWRSHIVCTGMYKHIADWLLSMIQEQPMPSAD